MVGRPALVIEAVVDPAQLTLKRPPGRPSKWLWCEFDRRDGTRPVQAWVRLNRLREVTELLLPRRPGRPVGQLTVECTHRELKRAMGLGLGPPRRERVQ
jgi:hypothetical protein